MRLTAIQCRQLLMHNSPQKQYEISKIVAPKRNMEDTPPLNLTRAKPFREDHILQVKSLLFNIALDRTAYR